MNRFIFVVFGLIVSTVSFAQEGTGHGRRREQQQQQSARQPRYKPDFFYREVVLGEAAQKLFEHYSTVKDADVKILTQSCSAPVTAVYFGRLDDRGQRSVCFDRGEGFTKGTRYKCYVQDAAHRVTPARAFFFDAAHNECGGDGIKTESHRQN